MSVWIRSFRIGRDVPSILLDTSTDRLLFIWFSRGVRFPSLTQIFNLQTFLIYKQFNMNTRITRTQWGHEELMYACKHANGENFSQEIYDLIAEEINRTPKAVEASMNRVLSGTSFIFNTKEGSKFKKFIRPTQKTMPKYQSQTKITPYNKPLPKSPVKVKRSFSVKLLWGLIEIKS